MSIAGALTAGGGAEPVDFGRLFAAMHLVPAGRSRTWGGGGVALGCCDGSALAPPDRPAGVAAVLDGRIDNRSDLLRALGQEGRSPPDAALLALAYERWGEDFLDRIVGDFACALWDGAARRLILGRDPAGMRPLHHWTGAGLLLFASEPRALLADPRVPKVIDERFLAGWLTLLPRQDTSTVFRGIERVPPGHALVIEAGGARRLHRFWRPETIPVLRLARDEDYADAVRAALDEAVRCRLPSTGTVGTWLSGGLDSSSVTALAARHLAGQGRRLTSFTAVPAVAPDPALYPHCFCDEGPLAATVARDHPNIDHVLVRNDASPLLDAMDRRSLTTDQPVSIAANVTWVDAVGREAQRRGIRVLLGGGAGNFTISYNGVLLPATLLRHGRIVALAREAWAMHRNGRRWLGILDQTLRPFVSVGLRRRLRRALGRQEPGIYDLCAINPAFAREMGLEEQAQALGADMMNADPSDGRVWRASVLHRSDRGMVVAAMRRLFGVEGRDPTADRRVMELCLSIPEEQFLRNGEPRALIRRAMAGILPPEILAERRKGLQSADWHLGFTAARPEMLREIERLEASPMARRCLDLPRLRRTLEDWPTGGWHRPEVQVNAMLALSRGRWAGRVIRRIEGGNG